MISLGIRVESKGIAFAPNGLNDSTNCKNHEGDSFETIIFSKSEDAKVELPSKLMLVIISSFFCCEKIFIIKMKKNRIIVFLIFKFIKF